MNRFPSSPSANGQGHGPGHSNGEVALLRRAAYLMPQDRTLVELVAANQLSQREIARLLGLPAGTVSRRYKRLLARLCDRVVIALLEQPARLAEEYRNIGIEHFLHRWSVRQLADVHGMKSSEVRNILNFVRGWARGVG